jgi:hypothetical protein
VKAGEFLRRVKRLARQKELTCRYVPHRGKGSHGRLYLGGRFSTIKDLRKELPEGLLNDMCHQLGIDKRDLF